MRGTGGGLARLGGVEVRPGVEVPAVLEAEARLRARRRGCRRSARGTCRPSPPRPPRRPRPRAPRVKAGRSSSGMARNSSGSTSSAHWPAQNWSMSWSRQSRTARSSRTCAFAAGGVGDLLEVADGALDHHHVGLGREIVGGAVGRAVVEDDEAVDPEAAVVGEEGRQEVHLVVDDAADRHRVGARASGSRARERRLPGRGRREGSSRRGREAAGTALPPWNSAAISRGIFIAPSGTGERPELAVALDAARRSCPRR